MKKFWILFITIFALAACGTSDDTKEGSEDQKDKLNVYTTVYPLQFFAEQIGGELIEVDTIYPPGTDEHSFDPTQKDMMRLADADLFFYIGLGLESFVEKAEKTLAQENVKFIATGEKIPESDLQEGHHHHDDEDGHEAHGHDEEAHEEHDHEGHDHDHGEFDPHVWISPKLSQSLALSIKDELVAALPEHAEQLEANYEKVIASLEQLDQSFDAMAHEAKRDTFFVSHAAFGYIADRYHLHQISVAGLNSQSEPSQKQLAALVQQAKEENIQYVLFEQNVSSKLTEVVQKEIGAKSLTLHNLSVLTEEDLQANETYFTLMERNIEVLRQALND